jgi:hypothetical protein
MLHESGEKRKARKDPIIFHLHLTSFICHLEGLAFRLDRDLSAARAWGHVPILYDRGR